MIEAISQEKIDMGSKWHSFLKIRIANLLFKYYGDQFEIFAELSIDIQNKEYKPDLAIYSQKPINQNELIGGSNDDQIKVSELPLCAIEIISPTQSNSELRNKIKFYLENGIQSAWLIVPEFQLILVFNSDYQQYTFDINQTLKDEFLGIELNMLEIFKRKNS